MGTLGIIMGLSGWRVTIESQDGCVQVYDRAVPQKTERCYALFASCKMLAISSTYQSTSCPTFHPSRQSKAPWIRTNKDLSSIVSPCDVEDASAQLPRVVPMVNQKLLVQLSNKSQNATCNPLLRNVLVVVLRRFVF